MGSAAIEPRQLAYGEIFRFWFPLGLMWLMMAAENPALTAIIARLPDAETNLAAFGVVFALSLVTESPIIQMLAAATALGGNIQNYRLLLKFTLILSSILSLIHLLIGITPLYDLIVLQLMGIPDGVAEASRIPFVIMAPFSMGVGLRRLWQGTLIRHGKTWVVPVTMISRILLIALILAMGFSRWSVSGAVLAATALSLGVIVAAIAAGILNQILVMPGMPTATNADEVYSLRGLLRFYVPLSVTTVVFLVARPVVTFGIARSALPARSLAVWPVLDAFVFIFNSLALSHQEASIALLKRSPQSKQQLQRFTALLGVGLFLSLLVTGLTPVSRLWFDRVSGLTPDLFEMTRVPLLLLSLVPLLITFKAWYRAQYVETGRTAVLAQGVVIYTAVLFVGMFAGASLFTFAGATIAAGALAISQVVENGYLIARKPRAAI